MSDLVETKKKLEALEPLIALTGDETQVYYKFLKERIDANESFVTILGETSSGKTTLINGLIGKHILPTKASPTTAAIVEVNFSGVNDIDYIIVNKNATMERTDRKVFMELAEEPDRDVKWLCMKVPGARAGLLGMRIFDTPGYDSIVDEHEEVLMDFIPNSDVVIYVVSYKIGIQDQDYRFLRELKQLIREGVPVIPVINRCPADVDCNDRRINEIAGYISDVIHFDGQPVIVPSDTPEDEKAYPLPRAEDLWRSVSDAIGSPERKQLLAESYDLFIKELYQSCSEIINIRYQKAEMSAEELEEIRRESVQTANRIRNSIDEILIPGINELKNKIPSKMKEAKKAACDKIMKDIDDSSSFKKDETQAYVQYHVVPFRTEEQIKEIQFFIDVEFSYINKRLDDYMNREIADLNTRIQLALDRAAVKAGNRVAANVAQKFASSALAKFFAGFGGAGGSGAGIANAASHALKIFGDLFGHTFSRETHNALKHFLAKIGATSMKAIGAAITVVIEGIMIIYDVNTWKGKLKKEIIKGLDKWESGTTDTILSELDKLKQQNIETINDIADEIEHSYDEEDANSEDIDKLEKQLELCDKIGKQIGA